MPRRLVWEKGTNERSIYTGCPALRRDVLPERGSSRIRGRLRVEVNRRGRRWAEQLIMTGMLIHRGEYLRADAIDTVASRATFGQHVTHGHIGVIGTTEELNNESRAQHAGYPRKCMGTPGKPLNIRSTAAEWHVCWCRELTGTK